MTAELRNFTPFANMRFSNLDAQGREFGVFMVKTAWDILPDGSCRLSDEQEPFVLTDQAFADGGTRYASDLVPWKPATDVMLNATTFAPGGQAARQWTTGARVKDDQTGAILINRSIAVSGPRAWRQRFGFWRLEEAAAVEHLALRYENAFGGQVDMGKDGSGEPVLKAFEENPVGIGYAKEGHVPADGTVPEPRLAEPGASRRNPFERLAPVGFGPIPAAWLPRRPLGGTYDRFWRENVWPAWPADYDFAFHNAASAGMTCRLSQGAGVEITLANMHPDHPNWTIRLPRPPIVAQLGTEEQIIPSALTTDTIFLDIAKDRLSDPRVFQISRLVFDLTQVEAIVLAPLPDEADASRLAPPPTPNEVARYLDPVDRNENALDEALA